ncbi:MAG TPA: nitrous oxide reductase family maturation protein NosD [Gemmatimonadales bacterium]|nr:nitrous oxide reductase family maturation protein NosD [Gemmatimonadales bacterium]
MSAAVPFVLALLAGTLPGPGPRPPARAPARAPARTLVVGPGGALPSPQAAVAAARAGDTVVVRAGRYPGLLVVDRPLALLGEPGAVLDGERRGTVVTVQADSVTLRGFTIEHAGREMNHDQAAVKLEQCRGCRVLDNTLRDPLHGIYLLGSDSSEIARNVITGAADLVDNSRGNGIHLFRSTGNRVVGNRIRGTRDGIYFSFASGNTVTDNDVAGVRYGLHYMYSDDNRFERNVFTRNAAGAAIMFSKRIVFRENVFARHTGYRAYGILLQTAEQVVAERNRIEGNLTGLFLDGCINDVFRDNLIAGNGIGVDVLASAEGNTFTGNVFEGNRTAVRKVLGNGENAWDEAGRGNWWGDARVFDLDGDGIGDRPYVVGDAYAALAAARPALELFGGTVAAGALAWAEDAFPVFAPPRVADAHPLAGRPALAVPALPALPALSEPPATPTALHPAAASFGAGLALLVAGLLARLVRRRLSAPVATADPVSEPVA